VDLTYPTSVTKMSVTSRWIGVIKIFVTNYDLYCTLMECKPQDGASDESPDGRVVLKAIPASHKAHY